jgi:hypothetical protein
VTTGETSGGNVEITAGLSVGNKVVVVVDAEDPLTATATSR